METDLSSRLFLLKRQHNKSLFDSSIPAKPFTLSFYLYLYNRARHDCYTNYMEGAKKLFLFLTSDETVPLNLEISKYPEIENPCYPLHTLVLSYELNQLAIILSGKKNEYNYEEHRRMKRAMIITVTSNT